MSTNRNILNVRLTLWFLAMGSVVALYIACGTQMPATDSQDPAGTLGVPGPPGAMGLPGPMGAPGADGDIRVYGNGSAGSKIVSADEDWQNTPPTNLMFTDFTVNAGVTLNIPSGTVIRCTGSFTNHGTIQVFLAGAGGGNPGGTPPGMIQPAIALPDPGISRRAPEVAELGDDSQFRRGSAGGAGILSLQGRFLLHPGIKAGGGGMGTFANGGGDGGCSFTVLAKTAVVNSETGTINADAFGGAEGSGGGGGGIIILASKETVTNNGALSAKGGDGGPSNAETGPGGGGGGGIINLLAPVINQGAGATTVVTGGLAGEAIANSVTTTPRWGGGGGGACRGKGGNGGHVDAGGTVTPRDAQDGGPGEVYTNLLNPSPLF